MVRLPREITLCGGETREAIPKLHPRHARFPLVQRKRWGIALLELQETFDGYFSAPDRSLLRRKARRSEKKGYRYDRFLARSRLDEMLAINASAPERQGRAMDDAYLDAEAFARSLGATWAGGSDEAPPEPLDAAIIFATCSCFRLLGHEDHLDEGVMYLSISEVARDDGAPRRDGSSGLGMYDTMVGAARGSASRSVSPGTTCAGAGTPRSPNESGRAASSRS